MIDWARYPNFGKRELACRCGQCGGLALMDPTFMGHLQDLRRRCGFPFVLSSGYRCELHPREARRQGKGEHGMGKAIDIRIYGARARALINLADAKTFPRMGISQSPDTPFEERFIHLGTATAADGLPSPTTWSY